MPCDSVIPSLGIHPKEAKSLFHSDAGTPMFTASFFTIAKTWKLQPKCPMMDV